MATVPALLAISGCHARTFTAEPCPIVRYVVAPAAGVGCGYELLASGRGGRQQHHRRPLAILPDGSAYRRHDSDRRLHANARWMIHRSTPAVGPGFGRSWCGRWSKHWSADTARWPGSPRRGGWGVGFIRRRQSVLPVRQTIDDDLSMLSFTSFGNAARRSWLRAVALVPSRAIGRPFSSRGRPPKLPPRGPGPTCTG